MGGRGPFPFPDAIEIESRSLRGIPPSEILLVPERGERKYHILGQAVGMVLSSWTNDLVYFSIRLDLAHT